MTDLTRFFWPESIALVGVSDDPGAIRGRVLEFLLQHGYPGRIYPVSPTRDTVRGLKAYRRVTDIPGPVDLAILSVQAAQLAEVVADCAAKGVAFAYCFTSGFAEAGPEGRRQQQELAQVANAGGVRLAGPNSAGLFNAPGHVPATFTRTTELSHLQGFGRPFAGPVGFVSQSGGLGFALQQRLLAQQGVGCTYALSTGNEADLEVLDYAGYMAGDPRTQVIVLVIEGLKQGAKLPALAAAAADARKPLIVAKFGTTAAGRRAATSHTARITGSDAAYDAMFRRHGIVRGYDEEEVVDIAAAFARYPLPRGRRVAILTTSGGAGVWMADACESAGLVVPPLDEPTRERLLPFLPSYGSTANPIDLTAQTSLNPLGHGNAKSTLVGAIEALDGSDAIDAMILVANLSDGDVLGRERAGLMAMARRLAKPLFVFSHAEPARGSLELLWEAGLCCFGSSRRTARALAALAGYGEYLRARQPARNARPADLPALPPIPARTLSEHESKAFLRAGGIVLPEEDLARSAAEAVAIAGRIGAPVALKVQSPQIPHKTEVGGVLLGARDAAAVAAGYDALVAQARAAAPEADIDGVLVGPMLAPGIELMAGIVHDPDFGPMLVAGFGGTLVEVLQDSVLEPVPVDRETALAMIGRLRGRALLEGARGAAPADVEAFADLLAGLSRLAQAAGGAIGELDLNPVFVYPRGKGIAVVDALLVGREREAG
jgi:acyl-CoA synthetase (NDP forming)